MKRTVIVLALVWLGQIGHAEPPRAEDGSCTRKLDAISSKAKTEPAAFVGETAALLQNRCHDQLEQPVADLAKRWHEQLMKSKGDSLGMVTQELYELLIRYYPRSKDADRRLFDYAELLWIRAEREKDKDRISGRWQAAAEAFSRVAAARKLPAKETKEAARAAVESWRNALSLVFRPEAGSSTPHAPASGPQPIPADGKKMLDAFDLYLSAVTDPDDPDRVMMLFLKGRLYWRYHHFASAMPIFEEIIERHGTHEIGEYAVNLLLDILLRELKYARMIYWVDRLRADKTFLVGRQYLSGRLDSLKLQSERHRAEALEDGGDHAGAGDLYLQLYYSGLATDGRDELIYRAGLCYQTGSLWSDAIAAFEGLIKAHPRSSRVSEARQRLDALKNP